jgi:hypothetical protein
LPFRHPCPYLVFLFPLLALFSLSLFLSFSFPFLLFISLLTLFPILFCFILFLYFCVSLLPHYLLLFTFCFVFFPHFPSPLNFRSLSFSSISPRSSKIIIS